MITNLSKTLGRQLAGRGVTGENVAETTWKLINPIEIKFVT
jgi:hypothetical protein